MSDEEKLLIVCKELTAVLHGKDTYTCITALMAVLLSAIVESAKPGKKREALDEIISRMNENFKIIEEVVKNET